MKKLKILALSLVVCLLIVTSCSAPVKSKPESPTTNITQIAYNETLTVKQMQEDVDFLVEKLNYYHPLTYKNSPDKLKQAIKEVKEAIKQPKTAGEFYFLVSKIAASLQDAHTAFSYYSTIGTKEINLPIIWLNEGICINKKTDIFELGDQIIKIGGKNNTELLNDLRSFTSAENDNWIRYKAETSLKQELILRNFNLVNKDNTVTIYYLRDNKGYEVNLPFNTINSKHASLSELSKKNNWISWNINKEKSIGYFRYDFCLCNDYFKDELKAFFTEVAKSEAKNLVVDLRYNVGGGSRTMDYTIAYLSGVKEYKMYGGTSRVNKAAAKEYEIKEGMREQLAYVAKPVIEVPEEQKFKGKFYMLISNRTFSASNIAGFMGKDNNLAILVGEPSGNKPTSYTSRVECFLPNTGYRFIVSKFLVKRIDPSKEHEDALMPDITVYATHNDIKTGNDAVMTKIYDLIKEKQ
ncbi:hypothetical protein IMX26_14445 [Clostridium sp. 'deep sea']|uniref:S41 family peptidase n=1 Tax=Clostridium sp. 'deep sea' TaxID=2779445 RepID=UPI0018967BE8|nr:S41 family peptidase [Clostridium sp. 'deep sea']QOR34657.1 hypothetical protein IMX26_14445 [Clostridium sp. 'deep sea']